MASILQSNHDISFIPTLAKTLAAIYYITNYVTKYDVSQYQLILTAAAVKRKQEEAQAASDPSEQQLRIRDQGMEKFALRAFNCLQADREISGPQAASYLLGLPDYYTLPTTICHLCYGGPPKHCDQNFRDRPDRSSRKHISKELRQLRSTLELIP